MLPLLLATLTLAREPVDLALELPEGRTLTWTHFVSCTERSHWGTVGVKGVILAWQQVVRGGRLGSETLEWLDVVEGVEAQLDVGARTVQVWGDEDAEVRTGKLQPFEHLSGTRWRTLLQPGGAVEWLQVTEEGEERYPSDLAGPWPPQLLAWLTGVALDAGADAGGDSRAFGRWTPGERRRLRVEVPVFGAGTVPCAMEVTLEGAGRRRAVLGYELASLGPGEGDLVIEALSGTGEVTVDLRRHLVEEHHQELELGVRRGAFPVLREQVLSTYLHRVRRRPPRRPRTAEPGDDPR